MSARARSNRKRRPWPTDRSEGVGSACTDMGDVGWVVPTAQFTAATYVPRTAAHNWQAAACAGTGIEPKGMLVAARTLALAGVELFENPVAVRPARDSFEERRRAGGHRQSRPGSNGNSVPRRRLQKGEEKRPPSLGDASPRPFSLLGPPAFGKLSASLAAWDNSGRFSPQPVLFCSWRGKPNHYLPAYPKNATWWPCTPWPCRFYSTQAHVRSDGPVVPSAANVITQPVV